MGEQKEAAAPAELHARWERVKGSMRGTGHRTEPAPEDAGLR